MEKTGVSLNHKRHPPGFVDSVGKRTNFLKQTAYMITNICLDWWVNTVGDGWRMANIKTAHSCSLLCHGTLDWWWWAYTKVRMFSTYCRSETLTNSTNPNLTYWFYTGAKRTKEPETSPNLNWTTYIMFQQKEKPLFDNNKHITQPKLPVLNRNNKTIT